MNGTQVEVYWNRTRRCWSVRKAGGLVLGHAPALALRGATFVVRPGGRDRVRATGKKQVHAWVRGELCQDTPLDGEVVPVTYNPLHDDTFVCGGKPITESPLVIFAHTGKVFIPKELP